MQALGMVLGNVLELLEVSVASSSVGTYSSDISGALCLPAGPSPIPSGVQAS